MLYSWARDSSLKGPLSTQDYKMSADKFSVKRLATEERGGVGGGGGGGGGVNIVTHGG